MVLVRCANVHFLVVMPKAVLYDMHSISFELEIEVSLSPIRERKSKPVFFRQLSLSTKCLSLNQAYYVEMSASHFSDHFWTLGLNILSHVNRLPVCYSHFSTFLIHSLGWGTEKYSPGVFSLE